MIEQKIWDRERVKRFVLFLILLYAGSKKRTSVWHNVHNVYIFKFISHENEDSLSIVRRRR